MHSKAQAFVQVDSVESATAIVEEFAQNQARIRNKMVWIQYSLHDELSSSPSREGRTSEDPPCQILLITVVNVRVPVTLENIFQVFKPHGDVLKIVLFTKNNVEFYAGDCALLKCAHSFLATLAMLSHSGFSGVALACHMLQLLALLPTTTASAAAAAACSSRTLAPPLAPPHS